MKEGIKSMEKIQENIFNLIVYMICIGLCYLAYKLLGFETTIVAMCAIILANIYEIQYLIKESEEK